MGTRCSTVAIRADRERAVQALCAATRSHEATPPEPYAELEHAVAALDAWMDRLERERLDGFPLLLSTVGEWTLCEDPQLVLPSDVEVLQAISGALQTIVVGMFVQTTSGTRGSGDALLSVGLLVTSVDESWSTEPTFWRSS